MCVRFFSNVNKDMNIVPCLHTLNKVYMLVCLVNANHLHIHQHIADVSY